MLVGQVGGCARLVGIRQPDNRGSVEQSYSCKETEARPNGGFGALFATQGQAILFGSVEGCVLVWDRKKGAIVYGLEHDEGKACMILMPAVVILNKLLCTDDLIQAVAVSISLVLKDNDPDVSDFFFRVLTVLQTEKDVLSPEQKEDTLHGGRNLSLPHSVCMSFLSTFFY